MSRDRFTNEKRLLDDRIKRNTELAANITSKVDALGMRRPPAGIGADLSDVYFTLEEYKELLDRFLATDAKDHKAMGFVLTAIQIEVLNHIGWHLRSARRPLERVIQFCLPILHLRQKVTAEPQNEYRCFVQAVPL